MSYPTKVQVIKRKNSEQWYINFPAAIAKAMGFERGEIVEWVIEEDGTLVLLRQKSKNLRLRNQEIVSEKLNINLYNLRDFTVIFCP